MYQLIENR